MAHGILIRSYTSANNFNNNNVLQIGNSVVKALLPRMLLLWRNSFPKTSKELESEKARGDAFTWQVIVQYDNGDSRLS